MSLGAWGVVIILTNTGAGSFDFRPLNVIKKAEINFFYSFSERNGRGDPHSNLKHLCYCLLYILLGNIWVMWAGIL